MSIKQITEKPLAWFKPDAGNVKLHSELQISQIEASIKRFGFRDPIATDENGNVIEGHGRLEACKRVGMRRVPCIILTGMTPREMKAYAIAHNQTTLNTGLDQTQVRGEFERLHVTESDYVSLGYSADDVLFMMDDTPTAGGTDHNGHEKENLNDYLEGVVHTEIQFGSQEQFDRFSRFLTVMRLRYPDRQTIAERIDAFVQEYGNE